jgi:mannose-6-phosphate isomerase-like protein (cupin superfamily)
LVVQPSLIESGGGEVISVTPERRVEILCEDDALHATWARFAAHNEGADLHIHREHTDVFYVLAGELTVRLGVEDEPVAVPAGTLARVPPYVVHGFRNAGDAEVRYLNFHVPGVGFADYLRGLRDGRRVPFDQEPPPDEGIRPASEATIGGAELVVDRPGLRLALLAETEDIAVAEMRVEQSGATSAHVHERHLEAFYVLEGELAFAVDDRQLRARTGAWVQIPAGVAHRVSPAGSQSARYVDVHAPSCGFGAMLRAQYGSGDPADVAAFDERPAA